VVTRRDVAQAAGVSTAVVSYVLNDGPRPVATATRAAVLDAIERLGYRPNGVARALATQRTRALALVVPDVANGFFAQLSQLIELAAFERGYTVLFGNTMEDPDRERGYVRAFVDRRVDGLILVPSARTVDIARMLDNRMPTVVVDREVAGAPVSTILVDNHRGGQVATDHLLGHGHRRIACLAGPHTLATARQRRDGWAQALQAAGVGRRYVLAVESDYTRAGAYAAARALLAGSDRPTAVFATAEEQVPGVFRAAADCGLTIPDDLAVVSFDSTDGAAYFVPGLTAVRQPIEVLAARAVDALAEQLTDPRTEAARTILPVDLEIRGSCGCPDHPPTVESTTEKGVGA
jgi:LacI family transcriptional regulator